MPRQVNRYGSGLRVMTGPNSSIGHAEEADIIGDDSPFGGWIMPVSPRGPGGWFNQTEHDMGFDWDGRRRTCLLSVVGGAMVGAWLVT